MLVKLKLNLRETYIKYMFINKYTSFNVNTCC